MPGKRTFGDYQTPVEFAKQICTYLKNYRHIRPSVVVEPTSGIGNFLKCSLVFEAAEYYGIEINPEYCEISRKTISDSRVQIINANSFNFSVKQYIKDNRQVLVIGNPPWVTNSFLSAHGSDNVPKKANLKHFKGLEAITGASNFDVCEYIIMRQVHEFKNTNTVIAMLCKTQVARNVFQELKHNDINFSAFDILEFDAKKVFDVSTSACLLIIQLTHDEVSLESYKIYDFANFRTPKAEIVYKDGQFKHDPAHKMEDFAGRCQFEWRQGVKHDCAKIMELTKENGKYENGHQDIVHIEDALVFPLIKSSMFKAPLICNFSKYVIVTQKKVREQTDYLKKDYPKTWSYLNSHAALFAARKSSIYRGAPAFSMFGVGDYSFAKYKVGVSGFYKKPLFALLFSQDDRPVMADDTSYFISFSNYDAAYVAMLLLNSEKVQNFLLGVVFLDAKRPYTKKVLSHLDFAKIVTTLDIKDLEKTEEELKLDHYVTPTMYEDFKFLLKKRQLEFA